MVGVRNGRASARIVLLVRSSARVKLLVIKVMVEGSVASGCFPGKYGSSRM
jgi:hypothetical protein